MITYELCPYCDAETEIEHDAPKENYDYRAEYSKVLQTAEEIVKELN